ncbi:hypothetical protein SBDP1_710004 [Syntrophobacter sp. SbD1]|nr:hypothetical protein SBDP1_710004 [Syntrophobacter sp. SbD1]
MQARTPYIGLSSLLETVHGTHGERTLDRQSGGLEIILSILAPQLRILVGWFTLIRNT